MKWFIAIGMTIIIVVSFAKWKRNNEANGTYSNKVVYLIGPTHIKGEKVPGSERMLVLTTGWSEDLLGKVPDNQAFEKKVLTLGIYTEEEYTTRTGTVIKVVPPIGTTIKDDPRITAVKLRLRVQPGKFDYQGRSIDSCVVETWRTWRYTE